MSDPFIDALATALAGQAVTALSAAGKKALDKVRDLVRRKSEKNQEMREALEAAEAPSAGEPEIKALAERLDREATADTEFAEGLRATGTTVHKEISGNKVVNEFSGSAGTVIQAGDIQGGINLG